ncbi:hypothetical protein EDC04DRAFT_2873872 [Pisolithus marmoratus]|nr:hypothetical protein EDC04DRAFT_2873872 [Pisolithus marmoratus]
MLDVDGVAIFHASFHPTKGTTRSYADLSIDGVEFSTLPSGLHLVDHDIVYFTKDTHPGVSVFRRRRTSEHGQRGFRLSALGVLLARSSRPRPWLHVGALNALIDQIYTAVEERGRSAVLEPSEDAGDWEPARAFFEERMVRRADLRGAGQVESLSPRRRLPPQQLHLPHPSSASLALPALTLYKHVLGRRRILIYTLPPVEPACVLCYVAADLCFEAQVEDLAEAGSHSHYDLVIDLTTSTPLRSTRPTLYAREDPLTKLSLVRFTWSDIRLWNEIERILQLDAGGTDYPTTCCRPPVGSPILKRPSSSSAVAGAGTSKSPALSSWADAWRVYEDVCLVCASLWIGSWRSNSTQSYSTVNPDGTKADWGGIRLTGDDDLTVDGPLVRSIGLGIEGRPSLVTNESDGSPNCKGDEEIWGHRFREERMEKQIRTTLALLQTFHGNTCFQLSRLAELTSTATGRASATAATGQLVDVPSIAETPDPSAPAMPDNDVIYLTPRDVLSFELGPFSALDARYLEWLGEEYGGGKRVVVRRSWKDLLGVLLGFG